MLRRCRHVAIPRFTIRCHAATITPYFSRAAAALLMLELLRRYFTSRRAADAAMITLAAILLS